MYKKSTHCHMFCKSTIFFATTSLAYLMINGTLTRYVWEPDDILCTSCCFCFHQCDNIVFNLQLTRFKCICISIYPYMGCHFHRISRYRHYSFIKRAIRQVWTYKYEFMKLLFCANNRYNGAKCGIQKTASKLWHREILYYTRNVDWTTHF